MHDPDGAASDRELVGVDVGGTFTDFVHLRDGRLEVYKLPTTRDQSLAIDEGMGDMHVSEHAGIVHGTTVATNALLERRGAQCALLTTRGFRDVLAIGRQNRPHLYRLSQDRPPPLVPERLRFEVNERLDARGSVVLPLEAEDVNAAARAIREAGAESVAIVFLHSYRNDEHERRAAALLQRSLPQTFLSVSSEVLPEYREYERTVTTVVNAYVQPLVSRYLERLRSVVSPRALRVMQSNGGTIGIAEAARQPARLVLSGPAGGVVGAFHLARRALGTATPKIITFDMGGTSTDVSLCPGRIPHTAESEVAGLPLRLPAVDIHTVGAGGGSIARVDAAGALHVGPESAGADPGPACYGLGGAEPTVTDANLVLGRLRADHFLGGERRLASAVAVETLERLGNQMGMSADDAAEGVIRVANATMVRALRRVSVERGHDPKDYVLVPFGGAGPLHACALADALSIRKILLPPNPGVLSAMGLLMADVLYDASASVLGRPLPALHERLGNHVKEVMADQGYADATLESQVDVRYAGQSYELTVDLLEPTAEAVERAVDAFHDEHERRYGHAMRAEATEVVTVRVRGRAPGARFEIPADHEASSAVESARIDGVSGLPAYDRSKLRYGHELAGPALVFQYDTTVYLADGWRARVDRYRNIIVEC